MTAPRFTRADLLDRLRCGPLPSGDWPRFAASRASLKVRICRLRAEGFAIEATPEPNRRTHPGGRAPVTYRLLAEPDPTKENA